VRFGSDKGSTMDGSKKIDQRKSSQQDGQSLQKVDIIKTQGTTTSTGMDQMMKT